MAFATGLPAAMRALAALVGSVFRFTRTNSFGMLSFRTWSGQTLSQPPVEAVNSQQGGGHSVLSKQDYSAQPVMPGLNAVALTHSESHD
ncbi:hypothetical protein B0H11DRAFT_2256868 [Mycena galericulata]|nr:hypothetical protein B0H11DRAFT_2256868 [Mycena galericulata]